MHIGTIHLYGRSFPPEIRLEKESWALIRAGHKVTVLTHKISEREASYEEIGPNFFVRREVIKKSHPMLRLSSFFTLQNGHYFAPIAKFIKEYEPDVLHVHDFTQVPTVLRIAARYNKPVVADLHENMPAALKANRASKPVLERCINATLFNYSLWRWHEARHLSRCAKTCFISATPFFSKLRMLK